MSAAWKLRRSGQPRALNVRSALQRAYILQQPNFGTGSMPLPTSRADPTRVMEKEGRQLACTTKEKKGSAQTDRRAVGPGDLISMRLSLSHQAER